MKYFIYIIISLITTSCYNSEKKSSQGDIETDSLDEQYWISHYENGQIKEKVRVKDGIWHGNYTSYYSTGNHKMLLVYDDGKKCLGFYEYYNALDTFIAKSDGEYRIFTEPIIKRYGFLNSNEEIAFELEYNEQGEIVNKFGKTIIEYYQPFELFDNDVGVFQFTLPNPPKTLVDFKLIDNNQHGKLIYSERLKSNHVLIEYRHKFGSKDSTYSWKVFSTILDEEGAELFVDSITLKDQLPAISDL